MAAFNKFNQFVLDLGTKVHDLNADVVKVYASNTVPSATLDLVKADCAEITAQNGYPAGGTDIANTYTGTGTATMTGTDVVWTAAGGSFGPLQYIPMYNDTPTSPVDPLIGWWDYGSAVTVLVGETFTVDFGASVLTLA